MRPYRGVPIDTRRHGALSPLRRKRRRGAPLFSLCSFFRTRVVVLVGDPFLVPVSRHDPSLLGAGDPALLGAGLVIRGHRAARYGIVAIARCNAVMSKAATRGT